MVVDVVGVESRKLLTRLLTEYLLDARFSARATNA